MLTIGESGPLSIAMDTGDRSRPLKSPSVNDLHLLDRAPGKLGLKQADAVGQRKDEGPSFFSNSPVMDGTLTALTIVPSFRKAMICSAMATATFVWASSVGRFQVRGTNNPLMAEEPAGARQFLEDIQSGTGDLAGSQGFVEHHFVQDSSASAVDDHHPFLHLGECRMIDQFFGALSLGTCTVM